MPDTVPIFSPDGKLGDIPAAQLQAAIAAGAKPGVNFTSPDGKAGVVPADRIKEATQAGGKIVPFEQQDSQHPGFWHAIGEDVIPAMKGVGSLLLGPPAQAYQSIKKGLDELQSVKDTGKTTEQTQNENEKAAGYGGVYRNVVAPLASGVGVNVPGMEKSAAEGDMAGVAGHTVVPTAAAAAPLAVEGAARLAINPTVGKVAATGAEVTKGAAKIGDVATFERLSKAANAIKKTIGGIQDIWKAPDAPPAPPTPQLPEGFEPPLTPPVGSATNPQKVTAPATAEPSPTVPIDVSKKAVGEQLEKSLEGQPLKPGVKLKDQLNFTKAQPVSQTKVESSALASHGYDPAANELHIVTKSNPNVTYVYGDVSQAQADAFAEAPSKGKAWAEFKQQSSPLVAKIVNGKRVPVRPVLSAPDAAQNLTPQWQAALDRVRAAKAAQ